MRIQSLTVRNYRIHRDCSVEFDHGLNVVGGPNEVGKSTLAEALHRAFFLRANVTGSARNEMLSRPDGGHPEVEVTFSADGAEWTLRKTFSGSSGVTRLSCAGATTLAGDEAEARISELLQGEEALGGHQAGRIGGKWGHLWVWQGSSGKDPSEELQSQAARLVSRLQTMGGVGVYVSDRDGEVARQVAERYHTVFTKTGKVAKQSELAKRAEHRRIATEEVERCTEAVRALEGAAERFRTAGERKSTAATMLERLAAESEALERKIEQANALERVRDEKTTQLAHTRSNLDLALRLESDLAALRDQIAALEADLASRREAVARVETDARAHTEAYEGRVRAAEEAAVASRSARADLESARALERWIERDARVAELEATARQVEELETAGRELTRQLSELAPVTEAVLERIRELDGQWRQAEQLLRAVAAEIEVIAAEGEVTWNGHTLAGAGSRTVTEEGELRVGAGTRIRLRPGGGRTLADRRAEVDQLAAALAHELERCGCASLDEARTALRARVALEARRSTLRSKIETLAGSDFDERIRRARQELTEAEGALARSGVDPADAPRELDPVRAQLQTTQTRVDRCETAESELRAEVASLLERRRRAEAELDEARSALRARQSEQDDLASKLEVLESRAGDPATRAGAIRELEQRAATLAETLAETEAALEALDPAQLEADRVRLKRAQETQREERARADTDGAAAGALLESNGSMDPYRDLKEAHAALDSAREQEAAARLRGDAVALLHHLFESEKEALTRTLASPLEERVNEYLQVIFPDRGKMALGLEGTRFTTPALRREERFDFTELSGGAREQFAAAVRLAVAEILAEEHDGALPVIFDDAFAHSDRERVDGLLRALDLAARKGLQVVVITCAPDDYVALGGRLIRIERTP